MLPLPLLVHEMKQAREDAGLAILNLGMLAQTLHSIQGDAEHLFNAYQPIAFTPTEPARPLPTTPDGAETDAPAPPEPAEPVSSIDVGQIVEALASRDPAAAKEAVAGLRDALMKNAAIDDVREIGRAHV